MFLETLNVFQSTPRDIDARCNLDIFEMTSDGHEPIKKCMNQELLSF
jgi:hypothetical protein